MPKGKKRHKKRPHFRALPQTGTMGSKRRKEGFYADQDHSPHAGRHRIHSPARPAAPGRTERRGRGPAGVPAACGMGRYDVYDILPTDGTEEEPSPSVYEQFIAQVSGQADAAVQAAQNSAASEASAARQAQAAADAAERAALNGSRAATSASRAESAALRAESFAPEDGTLLSVNGKGGAVVLDAQDVGALPAPVAPQAGALLRVLSIRSDGSLVVDTVTPAALKTLLEAT